MGLKLGALPPFRRAVPSPLLVQLLRLVVLAVVAFAVSRTVTRTLYAAADRRTFRSVAVACLALAALAATPWPALADAVSATPETQAQR